MRIDPILKYSMYVNEMKTILYKCRRIIDMAIVLKALITRTATKIFFAETNHDWLKSKSITAAAAAASSRALQELFAYTFAHASHCAPQPQRATLSLSYFSQPICFNTSKLCGGSSWWGGWEWISAATTSESFLLVHFQNRQNGTHFPCCFTS